MSATSFGHLSDQTARLARRQGHYGEAGMVYEQIHQEALQVGDVQTASRVALDASNCWHLAGQPLRSLTFLTEALSQQPMETDASERFSIHRQLFDFIRCFKPQLSRLQDQLDRMRGLCHEHPFLPISDLFRCEAVVARGQGNHQTALQWLERAWQHHQPLVGLPKFILAHNAAWSALEWGDREAARSWTQLILTEDQDLEDAQAGWWDMSLRLALCKEQMAVLQNGAVQVQQHAHPSEQSVWWRRTVTLRVRCLLLDSTLGDPQASHHPARQQLRRPPKAQLEMDDQFHRALLLVDYRLACLRYAVGLSPVEDLYHQHPSPIFAHRLTPLVGLKDIHGRVGKVRLAINRATSIARSLDANYRCRWRQEVLNERRRRLEAIQADLA